MVLDSAYYKLATLPTFSNEAFLDSAAGEVFMQFL